VEKREEFEDTKGVIRIRISKKNRQHKEKVEKDKQLSTKHTCKAQDRVPRSPLKTEGQLMTTSNLSLLIAPVQVPIHI
jgi:hypothetical protein